VAWWVMAVELRLGDVRSGRSVLARRGGLVEASCVRARRVLMGPAKAVKNLCTKGE